MWTRTAAVLCRETLDDIRYLTFLLQDNENVMQQALCELQSIKAKLCDACPQEKGLPLVQNNSTKETRQTSKVTLKNLLTRKRKYKFANRIGEKREKMDEARHLNLEIVNKEVMNIQEDVVFNDIEMTDQNEFTPINEAVSDKSENEDDLNFHKKTPFRETLIDLTGDDCNDTVEHQIEKPFSGDSIRSELTRKDLNTLSKNVMLNDKIINVFQRMMARDLKISNGLQDTVLGQKQMFKPMPDVPFVQVLHDGQYHWLTISSYGCQEGEINYYDSMFSGRILNGVMKQVCQIMKCKLPQLKVNAIPVQQQSNSVDCGAFALAFAYTVLEGKDDVSKIFFNHVKLRSHLLHAILSDNLEPFPLAARVKGRICCAKVVLFDLFCTCRQLWIANDRNVKAR